MSAVMDRVIASLGRIPVKNNIPAFRAGDTVKVHARIVEGQKERIQVFQGVVIRRKNGSKPSATFTVRKVSYNVGVERTFPLHSPRVEKIEVLTRGVVRRAKLFYLRDIRGKASKIKSQLLTGAEELVTQPTEEVAQETTASESK